MKFFEGDIIVTSLHHCQCSILLTIQVFFHNSPSVKQRCTLRKNELVHSKPV